MLRLKNCPKCHGDVKLDRDEYGWFEECLQCGFVRDLETMHDQTAARVAPWHEAGQTLKPIKPFRTDTDYPGRGVR